MAYIILVLGKKNREENKMCIRKIMDISIFFLSLKNLNTAKNGKNTRLLGHFKSNKFNIVK
jgi:hypothetical protein